MKLQEGGNFHDASCCGLLRKGRKKHSKSGCFGVIYEVWNKTIIISSSFPCRPFNKCIKFPNKWWLTLHYLVTANQHETFFWSTMSFLTPDTVDALFEKHGLILRGKWWICHRSIDRKKKYLLEVIHVCQIFRNFGNRAQITTQWGCPTSHKIISNYITSFNMDPEHTALLGWRYWSKVNLCI